MAVPFLLLVSACSTTSSVPDDVRAIDREAVDVRADAGRDARPDAAPDFADAEADAGPDAGPDLPDLVPTALPLERAALTLVSGGDPSDYEAAGFEEPDGTVTVVFERFDPDPNRFAATLQVMRGPDFASLGAAEPLALLADPFLAGPQAVDVDGQAFLYFMGGDYDAATMRLYRSRHAGGTFETAEPLVVDDPFAGNYAWPSLARRDDGTYALGYDHYMAEVQIAFGDGLTFGAPTSLGVGVQGRVAAFRGTGLAFTFQDGQTPDTCYVRTSADGTSWTAQQPLGDGDNTHDASPFARLDGGVDLYYIYPASATGFAIFRRQVSVDGTLGREQRVTVDEAGSFTQPHPRRLKDGRILLTFAEQVTSNVATDTWLTIVAGDAP